MVYTLKLDSEAEKAHNIYMELLSFVGRDLSNIQDPDYTSPMIEDRAMIRVAKPLGSIKSWMNLSSNLFTDDLVECFNIEKKLQKAVKLMDEENDRRDRFITAVDYYHKFLEYRKARQNIISEADDNCDPCKKDNFLERIFASESIVGKTSVEQFRNYLLGKVKPKTADMIIMMLQKLEHVDFSKNGNRTNLFWDVDPEICWESIVYIRANSPGTEWNAPIFVHVLDDLSSYLRDLEKITD